MGVARVKGKPTGSAERGFEEGGREGVGCYGISSIPSGTRRGSGGESKSTRGR